MAPTPGTATRSLRIGIDARAATEVEAGRGRVVRELLRAWSADPRDHLYVCFARRAWPEPLGEAFQWRLIGARDPLWHLRTARAASLECDVFLSTNSYLTVMLDRGPSVAIVYDLVIFDRRIAPNRRSALIERLTLRPAVRRAAGLVCISQATADAVRMRYPAAAGRITVATLGVAPVLEAADTTETENLPDAGFVLAVGTLEPRKNLARLVAAYRMLSADLQAAHRLVVVGAAGWRTGETLAALDSLGDRCLRLGSVSDAVLGELYRRCALFCYPSLAEGFGLPVLEAMAAGAPVLTSSTSSLPEVGGDAVAYVDPWSVDDIAQGLNELLRDDARRAQLGERGRARSRSFSWAGFGERVRAALEDAVVAGQPRSRS